MEPIVIEYAKSGRSKCKGCGQKILNREVRYGQLITHPYRNVEYYAYYHIGCVEVLGTDAAIEEDIGFCRVCEGDFSTPSVIIKCDDFMEHVHLKCCSEIYQQQAPFCATVDVTDFDNYDELSQEDKDKLSKAFGSDSNVNNSSEEDDDDDDEIEVVGETKGATAVAGSTFLGHDLEESKREFEEAEKAGNVVNLILSDEDDEDNNNDTSNVKEYKTDKEIQDDKKIKRQKELEKLRVLMDSDDDDDDDEDEEIIPVRSKKKKRQRNTITIDSDDDDDDDDDDGDDDDDDDDDDDEDEEIIPVRSKKKKRQRNTIVIDSDDDDDDDDDDNNNNNNVNNGNNNLNTNVVVSSTTGSSSSNNNINSNSSSTCNGNRKNEQFICIVCKARTRQRCSACNNIFYCSGACQRKDWVFHKNECLPPLLTSSTTTTTTRSNPTRRVRKRKQSTTSRRKRKRKRGKRRKKSTAATKKAKVVNKNTPRERVRNAIKNFNKKKV